MTVAEKQEGRPSRGAPSFPFSWLLWGLVTVFVVLATAVFSYPLTVLEVTASGQGRAVAVVHVWPGDTFCLQYIHSVEKTPVRDYFRIDRDGRIILYETAFYSNNTGMPTDLAAGERMSLSDGVIRVTGRQRVLGQLALRVSEASANTLLVGGKSINLAQEIHEGAVVIHVGPMSLGRYIWRLLAI